MAALGACTSLSAATYITMNELTTVAAVNALYPYMSVTPGAAPVVGSGTSDVAALEAGFTLAGEFVNTATGTAPGNVPTGYVAPVAEINTLGDAMANCVNSGGGVANDGTGCGNFFKMTTPTSGTAPVDTVGALLNLAKNPALNTSGLYASASPTSPFQPQLPAQPVDFSVALTPVGTLRISPSSIGFGSVTEGTNPAAVPVTIYNSSATAVTISSIGIMGTGAGSFSDTTTCGATLGAGASCTVQVSAYLTTTGLQSAALVVTSSGTGSPQSVGLSATGVAPVTGGTLSIPSSIPNWTVSNTYQDVTLTNAGATPIAFTASVGTSNFSVVGNSCSGVIAASSTCTVTVASTTVAAYNGIVTAYTDTLTIRSNSTNSPNTLSLRSQNANTPVLSIGTTPPYSSVFGSVTVGSSQSGTFYLNPVHPGYGGSSTNSIGGANPGDFSAPDCSATVSGDGLFGGCTGYLQCVQGSNGYSGCGGTLKFTPTTAGPRSAKLYLNGTYQYFPLSGTGVAAPLLTLSPSSLTFASTPTGGTTALQVAVLTASSSAAAAINSISITGTNAGDFAETTICPATLSAGAYCTIQVTFSPTGMGARSATLMVNGTLSTTLSGTGLTASTGPVTVSPATLFFGAAAQQQMVTLTNAGNDPLGIASIKFGTSNYTETDNCGSSLSGQSVCNIYVTAISASGNYTDTMTITDSTGTQTVSLLTAGAYMYSNQYGVEYLNDYGGYDSKDTKEAQFQEDYFLSQNGSQAVVGGTITFMNPNAALSQGGFGTFTGNGVTSFGCSQNNSPCNVDIYFEATSLGWQYDYGTDNGGKGYFLSVFGVNYGTPTILTTPMALGYGSAVVGQSSQLTLTVYNAALSGNPNSSTQVPFTYSGVTFSGPNAADFSLASTTCSTLSSVLSICTVKVQFTPQAAGVRTATVTISGSGTSSSALLTGTAYTVLPVMNYPAPTVSPTSLTFANTTVGNSANPQTVTVTMPYNHAATAVVSGAGFGLSGGTSCAQNASSCRFTVTFAPTAGGAATGTLTVTDSLTGAASTVALSGSGTAAGVPVVSLSSTSLTFIPRSVGTQSIAQTVTLTNTGTGSLVISAVTLGGTNPGDYAQTNNCVGTIAVNGTCTISVTNDPTFAGASSGTISVVSNAASSPNVIGLSGTGQ